MFPSGPAANGNSSPATGSAGLNSVISPAGVIRAIPENGPCSVNQMSPLAPETMLVGTSLIGSRNSLITPVGVIRSIACASGSVNQTSPFGAAVIASGCGVPGR